MSCFFLSLKTSSSTFFSLYLNLPRDLSNGVKSLPYPFFPFDFLSAKIVSGFPSFKGLLAS
jgi:hypothetical protein